MKDIGRFKVISKLGQGAFGSVYKGYDPIIKREAAIKVMSDATAGSPELVARFKREAEAAGALNHPAIVTIYELGAQDGHPYIAMEFLEGRDLEAVIKNREVVPIEQKIDTIIQVAEGLHHAHSKGVIHRDIKPTNIRLLSDGSVRIMDFGIAKLQSSEMTKTGQTMGTVHYMAPEQIRAKQMDGRCDLFALGGVFYEFLTFRRAFPGDSISSIIYQIINSKPARITELQGTPFEWLEGIVLKCLEKDSSRRFESCQALAEALRSKRQVAVPTDEGDKTLNEMRRLMASGKYDKVVTEAGRILETQPDADNIRKHGEVAQALHQTENLIGEGRYQQAQEALLKATQIDLNSPAIQARAAELEEKIKRSKADEFVQRGENYMKEGRYEPAIQSFKEALEIDAYMENAKNLLKQAEDEKRKADTRDALDAARQAFEHADFAAARKSVDVALRIDPYSREAKETLKRLEAVKLEKRSKKPGLTWAAVGAVAALVVAVLLFALLNRGSARAGFLSAGAEKVDTGELAEAARLFLAARGAEGSPEEKVEAEERYAELAAPAIQSGQLELAREVIDASRSWGREDAVKQYAPLAAAFRQRGDSVEAQQAWQTYFQEGGYTPRQRPELETYFGLGKELLSTSSGSKLRERRDLQAAALDVYRFVNATDPDIPSLEKLTRAEAALGDTDGLLNGVSTTTARLDGLLQEANASLTGARWEDARRAVRLATNLMDDRRNLGEYIEYPAYLTRVDALRRAIREGEAQDITPAEQAVADVLAQKAEREARTAAAAGDVMAELKAWQSLLYIRGARAEKLAAADLRIREIGEQLARIERVAQEATQLVEAEQWSELVAKAAEVAALNPRDERIERWRAQARLGLEQVALRQRYQSLIEQGEALAKGGDVPGGVAKLREVVRAGDVPSGLKQSALAKAAALGADFSAEAIAAYKSEAERLLRKGDSDSLRQGQLLVAEATRLAPEDAAVGRLKARIDGAINTEEARRLLVEADRTFDAGDFVTAGGIYQAVLALKPGEPKARRRIDEIDRIAKLEGLVAEARQLVSSGRYGDAVARAKELGSLGLSGRDAEVVEQEILEQLEQRIRDTMHADERKDAGYVAQQLLAWKPDNVLALNTQTELDIIDLADRAQDADRVKQRFLETGLKPISPQGWDDYRWCFGMTRFSDLKQDVIAEYRDGGCGVAVTRAEELLRERPADAELMAVMSECRRTQ